jgi:drug/metabolite transporter (DMT)-like permease
VDFRIAAVWSLACALWSSTYLFIRIGLNDVSPWTFAWVRLLIALTVLVPITVFRGAFADLTRRDVTHVMLAGVLLLGVNYGLVYWGAQFIPSGLVAILQSATPVIALALGSYFGSETVTFRKIAALATGVGGVALIFGAEARASGVAALKGSLAVIGSSLCIALGYVWLKGYRKRLPPLTVTTLQCLAGLLPLAVTALVVEGSPLRAAWSPASVGAVLYLALCGSVVAFWLNYWLLARMDASAMLMMGVAEVPIAVALGALVFGERLPPGALLGGACVLVGVLLGPVTTRSAASNT